MASPTVEATGVTTAGSSASVNKACVLPAGIVAGDGLILIIRSAGADTHSLPTNWSWLVQNDTTDAADDTTSIIYKQADGTEGTSVTVNATASLKWASLSYRISGHRNFSTAAPTISTVATGTSTAPDPTAVTISSTKDYLFLWLGGWEGEQTSPPAGNPTSYTNPIGSSTGTAGVVATNCRVASARRQLTTGTNEDPGSWTISASDDWSAWAVAVHPINFVLTPPVTPAAWAVATPTVVKGGVTLTPTAVGAAYTVATPTVTNVTVIAPAAVPATWAVSTPTLLLGGITLTPTPVPAAWGTGTPTLVLGGLTLTPDPVVGAWAVPTPTVVQGGGGQTLTPDVVVASFGVPVPTVIGDEVFVVLSPHIAASGENTTAQLTPPVGKTTGDFVAGRIQDDENPTDAIDPATGQYTELEWPLQVAGHVADGVQFEFRITISGTPIADYAVVPIWTVGTPVVPTVEDGTGGPKPKRKFVWDPKIKTRTELPRKPKKGVRRIRAVTVTVLTPSLLPLLQVGFAIHVPSPVRVAPLAYRVRLPAEVLEGEVTTLLGLSDELVDELLMLIADEDD